MAQWLSAHTAFAVDLNSVLSTHIRWLIADQLTPVPGGPDAFFWLLWVPALVHKPTHIHIFFFFKFQMAA